MKPTVCFITPPSPFLLDERVYPALGILKVAACAEAGGYSVEHLDLNGVTNYEEAVYNHATDTKATMFAVTATTPQMVAAKNIASMIRYARPDARLILGGPHSTLVHAAFQKNTNQRSADALASLVGMYDVVVCGDGELAIDLALSENPPSIINADDPKTDLFMTNRDLNSMPLPARHLIDLDSYHYSIDGTTVTPLIAQLGCPFGCNFCAGRDSAMLRRIRLRSTASVIEEMRHIYETYGIHGFMFFDDEINVNRQVIELLHAMQDLQSSLGVEFRCRCFVKSELFTEEQAKALRTAGFRRIMCGFESGSDRILKNINKRATKDDNYRAMELSHKYGLEMKALMSLGHPGESPETIEDTMHWVMDVEPSDVDVTIITAYPGSPYYDRAVPTTRFHDTWKFETNGDVLYMKNIDYTKVEDFYKGSRDSYKSYVFTDALTPDEIVRLRDVAEVEIRNRLKIPFYQAGEPARYEASMGALPGYMYRRSNEPR